MTGTACLMDWTPLTSDTYILNINCNLSVIRSATALLLLLLLLVVQLCCVHLHWNETNLDQRYISSTLFSIEAKAIFSKAVSTPCLFLALVVRCFIFGCLSRNSVTLDSSTSLSSSRSILLPTRMNGNFSGSLGAPWFRNSVIQDSMFSNDCIDHEVLSCLLYRRPIRSSQLLCKKLHPNS